MAVRANAIHRLLHLTNFDFRYRFSPHSDFLREVFLTLLLLIPRVRQLAADLLSAFVLILIIPILVVLAAGLPFQMLISVTRPDIAKLPKQEVSHMRLASR